MAGPKTLAFAQQKGGTGKTTSVCWMAWLLSRGHRVVVLDLDPQGGATALLGSMGSHQHGAYDLLVGGDIPKDVVVRSKFSNCMLVPATDALIMAEMDTRVQSLVFEDVRKRVAKAFQSFDYILIDCGSSLSILTSLAMSISDRVIMPLPDGELEDRALLATYGHMSRMRRDVADIALALPVMRRDGDVPILSGDISDIPLSSAVIPYDEGTVYKFQGLASAPEPDRSDPTMAAYFALIHELEGNEWQSVAETEPDEDEGSLEADPSEPPAPSAPSRRRVKPRAETMTDIFEALHEKRTRHVEDTEEPLQAMPSEPERPSKAPDRPTQSKAPLPQAAAKPAAAAPPPTYQSLRDIHNDTLEEAPKVKTWFWLRLGLSMIGLGVAIIGFFTDLIGPVAMWGAVIAVLILLVPDLILRFVLRDR